MSSDHVLLVGSAPNSRSVRRALTERSVPFAVEHGERDALDRVAADDIGCVVSDYTLDSGDGLSLLTAIRDRHPTLPVVFYTADGSESVAASAVAGDATAYVPRDADAGDTDDASVSRVVEEVQAALESTGVDDSSTAGDSSELSVELKLAALEEAPVGAVITGPPEDDVPMLYVNEAFEQLTGYDRPDVLGRNCRFLQGEETDEDRVEMLRAAVENGRPATVELLNYRQNGEPFWNRVRIAPIRDDAGEITHFVGFQQDVTARKEAQLRSERQADRLRSERRTLERVLSRVDDLVGRVTQAAVESRQRSELERNVCKTVVDVGPYESAWIGTRRRSANVVALSTAVGCGDVTELSVSPDADDPVSEALRTNTVAVAPAADLDATAHQRIAPPGGTVVAIPLQYGEASYGVLVTYSRGGFTVDGSERRLFSSIGRVVATGLNAIGVQRLLATDEVRELTLETTSSDRFFIDLAERAGCDLEYNGTVDTAGGHLLSMTATECDAADLTDAAATSDGIASLDIVTTHDDAVLVEVRPTDPSLVSTVSEHNGRLCELTVTDGVGRIRIELPAGPEHGDVVGSLLDSYDDLSLVSQRSHVRSERTRREFVETIRGDLTDKQLSAVHRANLAGYFEWPRPASGDEIAKTMGITRSTFHQHLRAAQRKIIGEFLSDNALQEPPEVDT